MFCTRCGRAVPEGARYCPNCGAAVTAVMAPPPDPAPAPTTPGENPFAEPAPVPDAPPAPSPYAPPAEPVAAPPPAATPSPDAGVAPAPAYGLPSFAPGMVAAAPPVYAGFWRRVVATVIDGLLLNVLNLPLYLAWLWPVMLSAGSGGDPENMDPATAFGMMGTMMSFVLVSFVISILYFALLESSSNQASLGKLAMGLRITDLEGRRITFGRSILRRLARIVTGFTLGIGYLLVLWTERKQTLHDLMVGTLVVRK